LLAGAAGLFALVFFAAPGKAAVMPVGDPFLSGELRPVDASTVSSESELTLAIVPRPLD